MCGKRCGARLSHGNLTTRPRARQLDRPAGTVIRRMRVLEVVEHVLCASRSPHGKKPMIIVPKAATAAHGDKPGVSAALGRHDHGAHSGTSSAA